MSNFFLSNTNINFLKSNYNTVYILKNINYNILKYLPYLNPKENSLDDVEENPEKEFENKKKKLKLQSNFKSVFEFKNDYMILKSSNINFSLDMFFDTNYKNNIFYIINYFNDNKNINLNFKNYSSYEIIEQYKIIIKELYEKRNIKDFNFDINSINYLDISKNKDYQIYKLLKKKIIHDDMEPKKTIIDLYLKDYKNAPESLNNIFNFIYFLRKFPIFKILILKYFKKNLELYNLLLNLEFNVNEEKDGIKFLTDKYEPFFDNIEDKDRLQDNKTIFDPFLNFYSIKNKLLNLRFLYKDKIDTEHDFLLNVQSIPYNITKIIFKNKKTSLNLESIYEFYEKISIKYMNDDEKKNNLIFSLYINLKSDIILENYFKQNNLGYDENSKENLNLIINNFVFLLFFIFEYYNLKQFNSLSDLKLIYNNNIKYEESILLIDENINILNLNLYYIYTAYIIFSNKNFYKSYKKIIYKLKHFFYIFKYFKNNNDKLFPLFIFLLVSDEKNKIIKQYDIKENNILNWLESLHDKFFITKTKLILN